MANALISTTNLLVLVFAATAAIAGLRARSSAAHAGAIGWVIGLAALIGLANAFVPALASLRERLPPAQPAMVLGMIALLLAAGLTAGGRRYFRDAAIRPLVALHGWRALFGTLLLAAGLSGGLPPAFFWPVALGDILAGLWAISIWRRARLASSLELKLWSLFGLADLLLVLPQALLTLPPFYLTHPDLARPLMLPLLGVPMLIALHVLLLLRFFADGKVTAGNAPQITR